MRAMKDSGIEWIGEIPEGWEMIRTKSIFSHHKTIVGKKSNEYQRLALTLMGVIPRSKDDSTGLQPEEFNNYQVLEAGNLVFKLIDLENVSTSRVGFSPFTGIVSPAYIILTPTTNTGVKFYYYHFYSMWQREIFNHMGDGGVRSALNSKDLLNIPLPCQPPAEQQRIAAYLDEQCGEIDKVLAKTRESIEEYKKLKQSVITEAVTKGIRPDRPMKPSGIEWIGDIPEGWSKYLLFQLVAQVKTKNENLQETNLLSLSYGKIKRKSIDTVEGLLPESFDSYNIIEKDDIVLRLTDLQNDHTSLRVGLVQERGIITSAYLTLRNRSNNSSAYLYYLLHSFDIVKGFYGMGSGVRQGLNWEGLKNFELFLPPAAEQQQIVAHLDQQCAEIDRLIAKKEQIITELEGYKKSLIYECVTGKREVC